MKTVIDRVVQYANRYELTNAVTGEVLGTFDFDEVTGTVQQVGTEIDAELFDSIAADLAARVVSAGGELAGTIVTFSDINGTAANVASGDKTSTLWGKVKNWFSRLKALAFKDKISNSDIDDGTISKNKIDGLTEDLNSKYVKPSGGIPTSDLEENAQNNLENVNKSLYNLGAYDTFVDNGNGTATITRKTGYFNLSSINTWEPLDGPGGKIYCSVTARGGTDVYAVSNTMEFFTISSLWGFAHDKMCFTAYNNGGMVDRFDIYVPESSDISSVSDLVKWLSKNPTYIQYELDTSYTEEVILDQPIHTIDQHGEQWLRDEWEKGLNLNSYGMSGNAVGVSWSWDGDAQTLTFNGANITNNATLLGLFSLPNDTYTIMVEVLSGSMSNAGLRIGTDADKAGNYHLVNVPQSAGCASIVVTTDNSQLVVIQSNQYNAASTVITNLKLRIAVYRGNVNYPWKPYCGDIVRQKDIEDVYSPDNQPPYGTLTFTGAVNDSFSANEDKTINIPTVAGVTPDITIGTVTTGAPGTDASATMTGTAENPILNLTIPRGDTGKQGEQGQPGQDGAPGEKGETGATPVITVTATVDNSVGTPSVQVTKSGTTAAPAFAFAFSNLKGDTGEVGDISASDITSGILPVARGGTGVGNLNSAMADLIQASTTSTIGASEYIPAASLSGSTAYRYTFTQLKDWLVSQGLGGSPELYLHNIHLTIEHDEYSLALCLPPIVTKRSDAYTSVTALFGVNGLFPVNSGSERAEFMPASGSFASDNTIHASIIGLQYSGTSSPAKIRLKYVYPTIADAQDSTVGAGRIVDTIDLRLNDLRIGSDTVSVVD